MYEYAKKYYEHHGDLEVKVTFKTNNGYEYSEFGTINLGRWISNQKCVIVPKSERGQKLLKIGMKFDSKISTLSWEEMYDLAKAYYEHHGNLEIKKTFKTNNGYEYYENGKIKLGEWVVTQRKKVLQESERGQKLTQIGMRFTNIVNRISWEEMYEYAKKYYEHYGDLEVQQKFKTNNGYEYNENGKINLGIWIRHQRKILTPESERGQKLLQIGMRFENINSTLSWEEMYECAKVYYEHYGNLEVPQKFKTNNGYEYNKDGTINLGTWISYQRKTTTKDIKRCRLLTKICMVWNIKSNQNQVQEICNTNGINININKDILSHISTQELVSKIEYLKANNIKLTDSSGKLHQIFNINSVDLEKEYNISFEDLITNYYLEKNKSKGV